MPPTLEWHERQHYRDLLRSARYSALGDAEGFGEICFAIEALGLRLRGSKKAMGEYKAPISDVAMESPIFGSLPERFPALFCRFDALYDTLRRARNDAMHTGVYARHAAGAAIELCIGLEDALMKEQQMPRRLVADYMVRFPVIVERWQPIAYARQLMLMHSFSFLPVHIDGWKLLSENAMARLIQKARRERTEDKVLARRVDEAFANGMLELMAANTVSPSDPVDALLDGANGERPSLWLVKNENEGLAGVLSPFELM